MQETLRNTVAELLGVDPSEVVAERPLSGGRLKGSLGRSVLYAAMRKRLGVECDGAYSAKTYAELEARVMGTALPANGAAAAPVRASPATPRALPPASQRGASCGVDIELVADIPAAADPWEHEWYRAHFSESEIAYCLLQPSPAQNFAGRWCAKEALKKCEPALMSESMANLELVSGASGAISFYLLAEGRRQALPHAVSISHTPLAAVAVVVRADMPAPSPSAAASVVPINPAPNAARPTAVSLALAIVAVILAAISLWMSMHR